MIGKLRRAIGVRRLAGWMFKLWLFKRAAKRTARRVSR